MARTEYAVLIQLAREATSPVLKEKYIAGPDFAAGRTKNNPVPDNKVAIKAVRFFISNLFLINIPTVEKTDFIGFLLRDGQLGS
tara:strand:- start:363 stop:614 length:252 start_codon:yes stop_codon:yes gene_type:complete